MQTAFSFFVGRMLQPFFQSIGIERGQMDPIKAIFRSENKGFGKIITGDDLAVFLCLIQKLPGSFGSGGVIQIKDPDNGGFPKRKIISDR